MKIGAKWEKIEGNINSKCINTKKEVIESLPLDSCGGRTERVFLPLQRKKLIIIP
jgi:hypothetical protein